VRHPSRAGIVTKKKSTHASEQHRPDVALQRAFFAVGQRALTPDELVVIDESGFHTSMARTHGRAPRGQRVVTDAPVNHGPNVTVLGALSVDGVLASMAVEGATTTEVFTTFIEKVVAPKLRPGTVVVLDNLSAHKAPAVQAAIEARQARLRSLSASVFAGLFADRTVLVKSQNASTPTRRTNTGSADRRTGRCTRESTGNRRTQRVRSLWVCSHVIGDLL
jgi:hypothetical protein